jgi:predicted RNase H-like HicB family nuclease
LKEELVLLEKGKPTFHGNISKIAEEIQTDKTGLFHVLFDFLQFWQSKQGRKSSVSIVFEDVFKNMKKEIITPVLGTFSIIGFPKIISTIRGYDALFLEEEKGYTVIFPKLPGCITQGDTIDEAERNAEDALAAYQECAAKIGVK